MAKTNSEISENSRFFGSISSATSLKNFLSKSKQTALPNRRSKLKEDAENIAPIDPNIQTSDPPVSASISFSKKSPVKPKVYLPKENLSASSVQEKVPEAPDQPVKVLVRIRPAKGLGIGDTSVTKVTEDSVLIGDRRYKFDAVLESNSTQEDVYELIGAPLVKDALSGYNTSIVAYGQTGSGKTYTMWGPPSAMVETPSVSGLQGIVPRIFQNLFSEIQKEQENCNGKQISYQCRCSFLEVYDEKIGDLLGPTQGNLEIKDDTKNGFYVENLTEEYVTSYEDVTQILIKGLSNRKIGATSINSKSSRSHIMFTCVIESWCKESSSKCFGSSKTSRICLVDLAGFDRNTLDDSSKQNVKEGQYIKKSISQLGHLVNILTEQSQSGQLEKILYQRSQLTHLLRESLGGNAKLSIICAVSPHNKNSSETLSTLRFGQRAKLMKNEPVVNEITEDDVNGLSDQIRQLKEELMRAKSCNSLSSDHGYFRGGNVRECLNKLRISLNRSLILPHIDNDAEQHLHINEEDVRELRLHVDNICGSHDENLREESDTGENTLLYSAEGCVADLTCEHYLSCSEESEYEEITSGKMPVDLPHSNNAAFGAELEKNSESRTGLLPISECHESTFLEEPVLSESPKIKGSPRKSVVFASSYCDSQDDSTLQASDNPQMLQRSALSPDHTKSSLRSSRVFQGPTENLAASLQRGLQIIDSHQRSSISARSSVSFSFGHLALKPCLSSDKANASIQTSLERHQSSDKPSATFVCSKCQGRVHASSIEVDDNLKAEKDGSTNSNGLEMQQTKDIEKDLTLALQRETEFNDICKKQADKIDHLNQMLEQYKCNSSNSNGMKNYLQPIEEDEGEECHPRNSQNKPLTWSGDGDHEAELVKERWEIKEIQEEPNCNTIKSFNLEEKEALLKEIESLRNKLQSKSEEPIRRSSDKLRSSLLSQSIQLRKSCAFAQANSKEEFEKERQKWMEMESEWISLTDDLRIDIESNRQRAEQVEMELRLEKKCTEELDDALKRSVLGHARMVEHYAELQEKYNEIVEKHRAMMEGVAELKRAAAKAGAKGRHGSRFAKALNAELSALRIERERERDLLRKENRSLKIQLKDTAEAVHAAGELLVRLKEAEETASVALVKNGEMQEENDKLRKQIEKLKRKHKMEMITMKQYLAESRLPESALRPLYREDSDVGQNENSNTFHYDDDQAWRAEFGAIYQEHF